MAVLRTAEFGAGCSRPLSSGNTKCLMWYAWLLVGTLVGNVIAWDFSWASWIAFNILPAASIFALSHGVRRARVPNRMDLVVMLLFTIPVLNYLLWVGTFGQAPPSRAETD